MAKDWSREENEAIVADYLRMLIAQERGQPYNKTVHRNALQPLLQNRNKGSIEHKHMNISAVLIEQGLPYIIGYKPYENYQTSLWDIVAERVSLNSELLQLVKGAVEATVESFKKDDVLSRWEDPPEPSPPVNYSQTRERGARRTLNANYLEIESRNISLGRAGEEFVMMFERERLRSAGKEKLAERVEHVSTTVGDTEGFDIRSFETNGSDRLIEVKTTAYGKQIPFFLSRNELRVSQKKAKAYHLYRLFRFRSDPRLYGLVGALDVVCLLDPVLFSARVK